MDSHWPESTNIFCKRRSKPNTNHFVLNRAGTYFLHALLVSTLRTTDKLLLCQQADLVSRSCLPGRTFAAGELSIERFDRECSKRRTAKEKSSVHSTPFSLSTSHQLRLRRKVLSGRKDLLPRHLGNRATCVDALKRHKRHSGVYSAMQNRCRSPRINSSLSTGAGVASTVSPTEFVLTISNESESLITTVVPLRLVR